MVNLLRNGNFSQSTGFGATSSEGPGWDTDYLVPSGGQLFGGVGAGAARYCLFTTNAAQVCNGQGATVPALDGRSLAVNVGGVGDIIRWTGVQLVNGARYRIAADAAIINAPYDVGLAIDGTIILPMPSPGAIGQWFSTAAEFTFAGTTGPHSVSIRTNSGAAGGNDHAFDNFTLERVDNIPIEGCCLIVPICYQDVSPCDVEPTQTTAPATAGAFLHTFNRASMINSTGRSMRTGGAACGSANQTDQQAADRMVDGNLSGITGAAVFNPVPPASSLTPIDAQFDLFFDPPHDNLTAFRVYHGYGNVHNDTDGIQSARVRVYDALNALLATVNWVGANNGAAQDVALGGSFDNVAHVIFDQILRWPNQNQNCAGIRELQMVGGWNSRLTWACGGTVFSALVQGDAAGFTVAGGQFTATAGTFTLDFTANTNTAFVATIETNNGGAFSSLEASPEFPRITVTGPATGSFDVAFELQSVIRAGYADMGQDPVAYYDAITGEQMAFGGFDIVACPKRGLE